MYFINICRHRRGVWCGRSGGGGGGTPPGSGIAQLLTAEYVHLGTLGNGKPTISYLILDIKNCATVQYSVHIFFV
jgi:hypothetical protein